MQYRHNKKILTKFSKQLDTLVMRNFIKYSIKDYDENETYIVYNNNKIEVFDESFLELSKALKRTKSYFISKPNKA